MHNAEIGCSFGARFSVNSRNSLVLQVLDATTPGADRTTRHSFDRGETLARGVWSVLIVWPRSDTWTPAQVPSCGVVAGAASAAHRRKFCLGLLGPCSLVAHGLPHEGGRTDLPWFGRTPDLCVAPPDAS